MIGQRHRAHREPHAERRRGGRLRARARRRDGRRRDAVRARGLRRGGVAHRRSGARRRHAGLCVRPRPVGPAEAQKLAPPGGWDDPTAKRTVDVLTRLMQTDILAERRRRRASRGRASSRRSAPRPSPRAAASSSPSAAATRRGRCCARSPTENVDWTNVHLFQVDERVAPPAIRTATSRTFGESLLAHVALPPDNVHAMPVEATDLAAAAARYAQSWRRSPARRRCSISCTSGLGPDGHTASLVPGDPVLDEDFLDVSLTAAVPGPPPHDAHLSGAQPVALRDVRRDRAPRRCRRSRRCAPATARIPAGRVTGERALIIADARPPAGVRR